MYKSDISSFSTNDGFSMVPPERDSASLKGIRYGPGHEKFPSWPNPSNSREFGSDSDTVQFTGCSSRSKSWTPETDYPKEKPPSCVRPFMKRANPAYTQQLKTVMENCEKIPPETYEKSGNGDFGYSNLLPPPRAYRDMSYSGKNSVSKTEFLGRTLNDEICFSPERDIPVSEKVFNQNDLELYTKKFEERGTGYANSEGYHSYISSECSSVIGTGTTPFMDQLRRHSESNWSGDSSPRTTDVSLDSMSAVTPISGRESVATVITNNSSNSSGAETLHWGAGDTSNSEIAVNGGPSTSTNSRIWEEKLKQSMTRSNNSLYNKSEDEESRTPSRVTDSKLNLKKFPLSTYTTPNSFPLTEDVISIENRIGPPTNFFDPCQHPTTPIMDASQPPSVSKRIIELEHQASQKALPSPQAPPSSNKSSIKESFRRLSFRVTRGQPQQPIAQKQSQVQSLSTAANEEWDSRIEKETTPISYTYLDPDKKHKVADVTLKAIQKNALLAYYERHTGKGVENQLCQSKSSALLKRTESFNIGHKISGTLATAKSSEKLSYPFLEPKVVSLSSSNQNIYSSHSIKKRCFESEDSTNEILMPLRHDEEQILGKDQQGDARKHILADGSNRRGSCDSEADVDVLSVQFESNKKYLPCFNSEGTGTLLTPLATKALRPSRHISEASPQESSTLISSNKQQKAIPPERPPKKPHLKNICNVKGDNSSHYVPYAHFRNPPPVPCMKATSQSPPPLPFKPTQTRVRELLHSPDLPPPPGIDNESPISDDPFPPPPSSQDLSLIDISSSNLSRSSDDKTSRLETEILKHNLPRPPPFKRSLSSATQILNNNTNMDDNFSISLPPIAQVAPLRGGYSLPHILKPCGNFRATSKPNNSTAFLEKGSAFTGVKNEFWALPNKYENGNLSSIKSLASLQINEQQMAMVSPLRFENNHNTLPERQNAEKPLADQPCKDIEMMESRRKRNMNEAILPRPIFSADLKNSHSGIFQTSLEVEKCRGNFYNLEINEAGDVHSFSISPVRGPTMLKGATALESSEKTRLEVLTAISADTSNIPISDTKTKLTVQHINDDLEDCSKYKKEHNDLKKQKEELLSRISRKLEILRIEQSEVVKEIRLNELLGKAVIERVKDTAKDNEFQKFKLHVEEIEQITNLLLGLSGRLARAENALLVFQGRQPNSAEKDILTSKRNKIKDQLEEAMSIKQTIDSKSKQVAQLLEVYLTAEQLADYQHFTKMKAKLITDARDLDEKIMLGEQQMQALQGL